MVAKVKKGFVEKKESQETPSWGREAKRAAMDCAESPGVLVVTAKMVLRGSKESEALLGHKGRMVDRDQKENRGAMANKGHRGVTGKTAYKASKGFLANQSRASAGKRESPGSQSKVMLARKANADMWGHRVNPVATAVTALTENKASAEKKDLPASFRA